MKERLFGVVIVILLAAGIAGGVWVHINSKKANELLSSYPSGYEQMDIQTEAGVTGAMIRASKFRGANKDTASRVDAGGRTPLHHAALQNAVKIADLLLAQKADVDAQDSAGMTPLHMAAANGSLEVAKLLIRYKADVTVQDSAGHSPYFYATESGNTELASLLGERGGEE